MTTTVQTLYKQMERAADDGNWPRIREFLESAISLLVTARKYADGCQE